MELSEILMVCHQNLSPRAVLAYGLTWMCNGVAGKPELAREARDAVRERKHRDLQVATGLFALLLYVFRVGISLSFHVWPSEPRVRYRQCLNARVSNSPSSFSAPLCLIWLLRSRQSRVPYGRLIGPCVVCWP